MSKATGICFSFNVIGITNCSLLCVKKIKENRWCFTIAKGIVFVSRVKNSKKGQNSAETNT